MSLAHRLLNSRVAERLRFETNRHLRSADESRRLLLVGAGTPAMRGYLLESLQNAAHPPAMATSKAHAASRPSATTRGRP